MSIKINKVTIKNLFEIKDIEWNLSDVNVLVGKNGSGKSTILNIMKSLMLQEGDRSLYKCSNAEISFTEGSMIRHSELPLNTEQLKTFFEAMQKIILQNNKKSRTKNKELSRLGGEIKRLNETMKGIELGDSNKVIKTGVFQIQRNPEEELKEIKANDIEEIDDDMVDNPEEDEEKFKVHFEYLSTINMSANSLNEVKSSDGNKTTVLDMEIKKEILRFKNIGIKNEKSLDEIKNRFISATNSLFEDSDKEVFFEESITFKSKINNKRFSIRELSSGERQLVYTLLKASIAAQNNAILLMDEPEISLHLSWQERLIESIRKINPEGQIIIVTHSPAVVMNGWMNSYIDIKNIEKRIDK